MIRSNRLTVVSAALFLTAFIAGCGNPLEGGSEPSGSVLRVIDNSSDAAQDIFFCAGDSVEYASMEFTVENQSTPNSDESPTTPDGTNSFVTLSQFVVNYTPVNVSGSIPGREGAFTIGVEENGTAEISMPIFTEPVLEYIRSNYPAVGNGQAMDVRVDVTFYGKDAFQVDVSVSASTTVTVDDFNPCSEDIPPPDEASL